MQLPILQDDLLLSHLNESERKKIEKCFSRIVINAGDRLDTKRNDLVYIVQDGYLRSEGALQRQESVLIGKSSILGAVPFTSEESRGAVRALTEVVLLGAKREDLTKAIRESFPVTRGYLSLCTRAQIPLMGAFSDIARNKTNIIAVVGSERGKGRSFVSLMLSRIFSKKGTVIACDFSYNGKSLADYCSIKMLPPMSQKKANGTSEDYLKQIVVESGDKFSIVNVCSSSKVKVDTEILHPLFMYLSSRCNTIICDCSVEDEELTKKIIEYSDIVIAVSSNTKGLVKNRKKFESCIREGQLFQHVCNKNNKRIISGESDQTVDTIPELSGDGHEIDSAMIFSYADSGECDALIGISEERDLVFLDGRGYESVLFAGLVPLIAESVKKYDIVYAHSFALPLFAGPWNNPKEYSRFVRSFFSEDRILSMLKFTYPGKYLVNNSGIVAWAKKISQGKRMNRFIFSLHTSVKSKNYEERLVSAGDMGTVIASALCDSRFVKPIKVENSDQYSVTHEIINPNYFLRHPINTMKRFGFKNKSRYSFGGNRGFEKMGLWTNEYTQSGKWSFDKNIIIDVDCDKFNTKKILRETEILWKKSI